MSTWLLWRLVKFVGLAAFAAGSLGLWAVPSRAARLALVYRWATPGFSAASKMAHTRPAFTGEADTPILPSTVPSAGRPPGQRT